MKANTFFTTGLLLGLSWLPAQPSQIGAADTVLVQEAPPPAPEKPLMLVRNKQDTVLLVREGDVDRIVNNIGEKIDMTRQRGYGGAGGPSPGLLLADMKPVQDLVAYDAELKQKDFGISRWDLTVASGGMGYGGIGNGIRIGGGGWGGSLEYSDIFGDSVAMLDVEYGLGGLLIEKAFVSDRWNYMGGAFIGGGHYKVTYYKAPRNNASFFSNPDKEDGSSIETNTGMFSALGGFTYTILPWFHVGADGSLTFMVGSSFDPVKWNGGPGTFITLSPGLRVRIMFGNIG